MNDEYELVKFEQNGLTLDVNVSPQEETVWLSKEQIAFLFDRDRSVISRHINNIYKEGELPKESSCAKNAHEVNGQIHYTEFFNLDVIISVGYRVKSQNGVVFRKWANNVLKQYLLKGYVVNENRTLVTNENYINDESSMVTVDGISYYEPNLAGYALDKTSIVYYEVRDENSTDTTQLETEIVSAEDYIKNGKQRTIQKGNKTYEFYNYAKQRWANILVENNDMKSYWVWIPR